MLFAGGSPNPYTYDGIGYDGEPSPPSSRVFAFDLDDDAWREVGRLPEGTMDHRGLLETKAGYVIVGGMRAGPRVVDEVIRFGLDEAGTLP